MRDLLLLPAGVIAGVINAVAGGGSLLTFPMFLALGYPPYVANVTNAVGVFASNIGAVWAYRAELRSARRRVAVLCLAGIIGSVIGTTILLHTGESTFEKVVPYLIFLGAMLVLFQPRLVRLVQRSSGSAATHFRLAFAGTVAAAIYGGYFGAAMGVLFLGVFGAFLHQSLQQTNAYKNAVAFCVNAICVVAFGLFAPVAWRAAAIMTVGTVVGGWLGARIAMRLSDKRLRACIVVIGITAALVVGLQ